MLKTSTTSVDLRASLVTNERVRCQNVPIKMTSIRSGNFAPPNFNQSQHHKVSKMYLNYHRSRFWILVFGFVVFVADHEQTVFEFFSFSTESHNSTISSWTFSLVLIFFCTSQFPRYDFRKQA